MGGMAAVAGTLITTWLVPAMTNVSYAPIFILVAALVPVSLLRSGWSRPRRNRGPAQPR